MAISQFANSQSLETTVNNWIQVHMSAKATLLALIRTTTDTEALDLLDAATAILSDMRNPARAAAAAQRVALAADQAVREGFQAGLRRVIDHPNGSVPRGATQ
jgi:hypothetical protein